jgi:UMP-CMP kinase
MLFRVIFILGGPGAGKGTQSALLEEQYPCLHLSVGELLRNGVPPDSPYKETVEACLVAGQIVPVEISLGLLQAAMERAVQQHQQQQQTHSTTTTTTTNNNKSSLWFLVDGFPRNFDNLRGWMNIMAKHQRRIASVWAVLMFTCPLQELERRILSRAETSGRSDDNLDSAQKRFATFERDTVPVVNALRQVQQQQKNNNSASLQVVDIAGYQPLSDVWQDVQQVMNRLIANDVWTANAQLVEAMQTDNAELYRQWVAPELLQQDSMESLNSTTAISNAQMEFVSGQKVLVSYDLVEYGVRETRVWSHQQGQWINVHYFRTPILE